MTSENEMLHKESTQNISVVSGFVLKSCTFGIQPMDRDAVHVFLLCFC
jgi:hypothetical protein